MYVTVYTRNRAAEKKAQIEAEIAARVEAEKAAPKKRGRPRKTKGVAK